VFQCLPYYIPNVYFRNVNDEALSALKSLNHLTSLDISHCAAVSDQGLQYLAGMPSKLFHFFGDGVLNVSDW